MGAPGLVRAGAHLRRLSADWQAKWGRVLERAGTFGGPSCFRGAVHKAANWLEAGRSRGCGRSNGRCPD